MLRKEKFTNNDFKLNGKFVFFATHNIHKFNEARAVLAKFNINLGMLKVKNSEIQSDSLKEIAQKSALEIFKLYRLPILVEDSGLFVEALNGFPGPYAEYVYKTIGNNGLLTIMEKIVKRKAIFRSAIAYCNNDKTEPFFFKGEIVGTIANKEPNVESVNAFGFDPIFYPKNNSKSFAQMSIIEKNSLSHRAIAFRKFSKWYIKYKK